MGGPPLKGGFRFFKCTLAKKYYSTKGQSQLEWNYEENGPDTWFLNYPDCAGKSQSPINIQNSNTVFDSSLKPFNFKNHNESVTWNFFNDGYDSIFLKINIIR